VRDGGLTWTRHDIEAFVKRFTPSFFGTVGFFDDDDRPVCDELVCSFFALDLHLGSSLFVNI
jgi:hypothetical protein